MALFSPPKRLTTGTAVMLTKTNTAKSALAAAVPAKSPNSSAPLTNVPVVTELGELNFFPPGEAIASPIFMLKYII